MGFFPFLQRPYPSVFPLLWLQNSNIWNTFALISTIWEKCTDLASSMDFMKHWTNSKQNEISLTSCILCNLMSSLIALHFGSCKLMRWSHSLHKAAVSSVRWFKQAAPYTVLATTWWLSLLSLYHNHQQVLLLTSTEEQNNHIWEPWPNVEKVPRCWLWWQSGKSFLFVDNIHNESVNILPAFTEIRRKWRIRCGVYACNPSYWKVEGGRS